MTAKLQRFGYVRVEDQAGHIFPAHEFHYAMALSLIHISSLARS